MYVGGKGETVVLSGDATCHEGAGTVLQKKLWKGEGEQLIGYKEVNEFMDIVKEGF